MAKVKLFGTADADIWVYIQAILAILLVALAVVLAIYSFVNLAKQGKQKAAEE